MDLHTAHDTEREGVAEGLSSAIPPSSNSSFLNPGCYSAEKETMLYRRKMTDLWMVPIASLLTLWLLYIICDSLSTGDGRRLHHGYDYKGRLCSVDIKDSPYVYWPPFPNSQQLDVLSPICVPKCPNQKNVDKGATVLYPNRTASVEILPDGSEITQVDVHPVEVQAYASRPFGGQYCFPIDTLKTIDLVKKFGLTDTWMVSIRVFKSLQVGWPFLIFSGVIAALLSFGYLLFIPKITRLVCWLSAAVAPLGIIVASAYLVFMAYTVPYSNTVGALLDWVPLKYTLLTTGFVGILFGIYLLFSDSETKRHARQAIALSEASWECAQAIPSVFVFPLCGSIIAAVIWMTVLFVIAALLTSPPSIPKPSLLLPTYNSRNTHWTLSTFGISSQFQFDYDTLWRCWFVFIGCIWTIEFTYMLTQFCVSFAVALWYFTIPDLTGFRYDVPLSIIGTLWVALRYHLGSLQLSAFLVTFARCLQYVGSTFRRYFEIQQYYYFYQSDMPSIPYYFIRYAAVPIINLLHFLLKSAENSARFINHGGLIEVALYANDFLPSCASAYFHLHGNSIHSISLLGRVNSIISLINSLGTASALSGLTLWISSRHPIFNDPSSSWFIDSPAGLSIASFALVASIMHIAVFSFDQMSATLLYCYSIEGRRGIPVFVPDPLRALIEECEAEFRLTTLGAGARGQSLLSIVAHDPGLLDETLKKPHPNTHLKEEEQQIIDKQSQQSFWPPPNFSHHSNDSYHSLELIKANDDEL